MRGLAQWIIGDPRAHSLNERVFHSFVLVAGAGFAAAAVFSVLSQMGQVLIVACTIQALFYAIIYYLSRHGGLFRFVYTPALGLGTVSLALLWFLSGGLEGSVPLIFILGAAILVAILDGRWSILAALLLAAAFVGTVVLESLRPEWVIPYPTPASKRADLVFTALVGITVVSVVIGLLRRNYESERRRVESANTQLRLSEQKLIEARDAAERASRARADFLSTMSHEIRTPMNSVVGMTHLLLQESPRADQRDHLRLLHSAAEHLLGLVNDILDFSKIEDGRIQFEHAAFSLSNLLGSMEATFGPRAREKGLSFRVLQDERLPPGIWGDATRLGQVVANLIANAVKFTGRGSVTVEASLVEGSPPSDLVELQFAVSDTGIGIPKEKHEFVFEKFAQASSDTTRRYGGTGLGLAISKRLLELMGSRIELESAEGRGSRFWFRLKARPVWESARVEPRPEVAFASLAGLRILLVEDFEPNVVLTRTFLTKWEAIVDVAWNGREAVELAQTTRYDLVLMDLQMPEMDGFEAARRIRSLGADQGGMPIVALTAAAMSEEFELAMAAGMTDFVTKPFHPRDLHAKIERLTIGRKRPSPPTVGPPPS